jgi:hypothetical protein
MFHLEKNNEYYYINLPMTAGTFAVVNLTLIDLPGLTKVAVGK